VTLELPLATDLRTLLTMDAVSPDAFLAPSGHTGWGRIYGGQAIAQALRAAAHTVDDHQVPHSLHAYYVRPGDEAAPVLYEVQRIRDGRSFSTRQVIASQSGGAILNCIASFHSPETSEEREATFLPAETPRPDALADDETPLFFQTRARRDEHGMATMAWMRTAESFGDDPVLNACALAYLSDEHLLGAALTGHSLIGDFTKLMTASLDQALWFHRPVRVDDWLCFLLDGQGMSDARGLSIARIFDGSGTHVATAAQEALGRPRR
jgi:acyl-CoA thioesterase-2